MTVIGGIGPTQAPVRSARAARGDRQFGAALDSAAAQDIRETAGAGATSAASMLLSLQEIPDATERNRRARARTEAALAALRDMQLALLGGGLDRARLVDLAAAADAAAEAEDPALRRAAEAVQLRAAIELARLEHTGV
jgi:hypothetical protein